MSRRTVFTMFRIAALAFMAIAFASCGSMGPDTSAPLTPENFRRTGGGDGTNLLAWVANRERDLAGYRLYRAEGDPTAGYTMIADLHPDTTSYADVNLEYTTQYFYTLTAYDSDNNESVPTDPVMGIPANLSAPDAPENVRVVAQNLSGSPSVTISWSPNTEGDLDAYRVFRGTEPSVNPLLSTPIATVPRGTTIYIDTNVNIGARYYYRIVAVDRGDLVSQPSTEASDIPLSPPALTMPANGATAGSISPTFGWQLVNQAVGYRIIVGSDETFSVQLWNHHVGAQTSTLPYAGQALTSGNQYFWYVVTTTADPTKANSKSPTWSFVAP